MVLRGKIHNKGHFRGGGTLKIKTFLGPEKGNKRGECYFLEAGEGKMESIL